MLNLEEKVLVLDTETTNNLDDPIAYDVGFAVIDNNGTVYEQHSYVVADVFLDRELMASAYFKDKQEQYWNDIKNGRRRLMRYKTIKRILFDVCEQYNIKKIVAHNAKFDYKSTVCTQRYLTSSKYRYFIPKGVKFWDSLRMARETFGEDCDYIDFCKKNGYICKNGQIRFTAEILYRYLTGDNDFMESHTGLEDVLIEKDIYCACLSKNPEIDGRLWRD